MTIYLQLLNKSKEILAVISSSFVFLYFNIVSWFLWLILVPIAFKMKIFLFILTKRCCYLLEGSIN